VALLLVIERREHLGLFERCAVLIIDSEIQRVLGHHSDHHAVEEYTGLAEHTAHRDAPERRELIAQKFGEGVACDHFSALNDGAVAEPIHIIFAKRSTVPSCHVSMLPMHADQHDSELGQWQTVQRAAHPRLRAYVHGYFASSSHLLAPVQERHLPSTEVPLLLNFGEPHRRFAPPSSRASDTAAGEWTARDGAWIVGLHTRHQLTHAVGERHFMVVRFTPIGAHLFLGVVPMDAIANDAIDVAQIDARLARELIDRVGRARTWTERFVAIEAVIAERIADARHRSSVGRTGAPLRSRLELSNSVAHVWQTLVAHDGRVALGSLADELDCSHRTLIARFRTSVGFPPKTIARLLRFNHVVRSLDRAGGTRANELVGKPYIESSIELAHDGMRPDGRRPSAIRWADIATDCGYFDQAHLIKDFREFAGATPAAFLRRVSDVA
jgi:AraC-like DNA-binding protein